MRDQQASDEQTVAIAVALAVFVLVLALGGLVVWLLHAVFAVTPGSTLAACLLVAAVAAAVTSLVRSRT